MNLFFQGSSQVIDSNDYLVLANAKSIHEYVRFNRNISYWEENEEWLSNAYADRDYLKLSVYTVDNPIFRNKMMWYWII